MRTNINFHCILFCILIFGCTEGKDYIESRVIYKTTDYSIEFDIYKVGYDNYQLDFFYSRKNLNKKILIQSVYLNDAHYKSEKFLFEVLRNNNIIEISCNRTLLYTKKQILLNDLVFNFDEI